MMENTPIEMRKTGDRPIPKVIEGSQGLAVTRIGKSFRRHPVVRGVSLTLRRGEVVGLLGPNGAGKTTCFYMITACSGPTTAASPSTATTSRGCPCIAGRARDRLSAAGSLHLPWPHRRREHPRRRRIGRARRRPLPTLVDSLLAEVLHQPRRPRRPSRSPAASAAVEIARARPPTRPTSCSTSPSPASTRSPSTTSASS